MTEPTACDPDSPDMPKVPEAAVQKRKRQFSIVWLVPVVAALIGGWLIVKAYYEKGPEITITFKSAEGLEAGKTKIKFKDVEIGLVQEIRLGEDLSHVKVKAQLVKEASRFLSENTRFWVVRARVSASAVTGLGTVFSGAFIDVDPGPPGKSTDHFVGLEEPPIVTTGLPGRHFILESNRLGSIEVGTQVYYRQIRVGEVVAYHLAEDGKKIVSKIFVHAPYDQYVRKTTRFWNASGLDVKVDAGGLKVDMESIISILVGGIAFDFGDSFGEQGERAEAEHVFTLYPTREAAQEKVYGIKNYYVLLFDESVRGLSPGAPVEFRGIQIGQVVDIKSEFDLKMNKLKIPVIIAAEPERISFTGKLPEGVTRETLVDYLVDKGLRAQLRTGSLLTGQMYVALDLFPNAKPGKIVRGGRYGYPEFPTTPTPFEEIGSKVTELVAKFEKIPIEQIGRDLGDTIKGAKGIATSAELAESIRSLNAALKEVQLLTQDLRTRVTPELSATLEQTRKSLAAADESLSADSPTQERLRTTLDELAKAARSLKDLTDYLERHPEAVLSGKEK
ncbi:MAG: intermembrane transport protein PqiB [Hyphomicrobiales bacterium]